MTSGLPDSKTSTSKPSEPACTSASYLPSIQPTKAKRDKKKIAHKVAQVATNHVGINTDSTDAAESKDETSSSVRPKAQHGPTRTAAIPPDSNPKKDKSKGKSKKSKTDPKSSSKSNRPRLHPTQLTELATKIFNPALFPRQPPRTPPMYPPPGLCYSRLPPPCAEVDDGPTWRRRRWRVWDEVYTPLRRVVLNDHLRGQLRRHQTFAMAPSTSDNVNYPVKGIHRRIFPRGREIGLTIETYGDRPHLSELHRWREARPRAWSGHTAAPSSKASLPIPLTGQNENSGTQPPLTPLEPPSPFRSSIPASPLRLSSPHMAHAPPTQTLQQAQQTGMPILFHSASPPKLNPDQRKVKREQLRVHKWILDIENERRWRTGMRRLMDDVYHFQEGCMLEPNKWQDGQGVFLPDFDYDNVQAFADKFKAIRQSPEKIYELYPDLGPVPGRAEAQRLIDEDEEERRKRKEAKKAKKADSGSGSASPSPPLATPEAVKPATEEPIASGPPSGDAVDRRSASILKPPSESAATPAVASASTPPAKPVKATSGAARNEGAGQQPASSVLKAAPTTTALPAAAGTTKPTKASSRNGSASKQAADSDRGKGEPSPRDTASAGSVKGRRSASKAAAAPAEAIQKSSSNEPSTSSTSGSRPPSASSVSPPHGRSEARPTKPSPSSDSSANSTSRSPTSSSRLAPNSLQFPTRSPATSLQSCNPPPDPLETLLAVLHTVEAQSGTLPGPAAAARKLRRDIERSSSVADGFKAGFGPDESGKGAEMLRLARIMGALEQMDVMIMRHGSGGGAAQESAHGAEGRGEGTSASVTEASTDPTEESKLDVRLAGEDGDEACSDNASSDSEDDTTVTSLAADDDGSALKLGRTSKSPTYRWGSINMDDDTRAPCTAPASAPDSYTAPRPRPMQRRMLA